MKVLIDATVAGCAHWNVLLILSVLFNNVSIILM
jgi:hypothetical protein